MNKLIIVIFCVVSALIGYLVAGNLFYSKYVEDADTNLYNLGAQHAMQRNIEYLIMNGEACKETPVSNGVEEVILINKNCK